MQKKFARNQNLSYRLVVKTPLPEEQRWGRSKYVRRDERFISLAQMEKFYHELKW